MGDSIGMERPGDGPGHGDAGVVPGGLGAAELSMTGMLTLLMGLSSSSAATAALIIRFATLWFGVGLGLLTWLASHDLLLLEPRAQSSPAPTPPDLPRRPLDPR